MYYVLLILCNLVHKMIAQLCGCMMYVSPLFRLILVFLCVSLHVLISQKDVLCIINLVHILHNYELYDVCVTFIQAHPGLSVCFLACKFSFLRRMYYVLLIWFIYCTTMSCMMYVSPLFRLILVFLYVSLHASSHFSEGCTMYY